MLTRSLYICILFCRKQRMTSLSDQRKTFVKFRVILLSAPDDIDSLSLLSSYRNFGQWIHKFTILFTSYIES